MTSITMWDDVTASLIPADAEYVAYYTDGTYANEAAIAKRCPKAKLLSIAVRSADKANVLDVETGDAEIADIYYWLHAGQTGGIAKCPVIYTSVSNVNSMMLTMNANKFVHGKDYLIWSAHYTGAAHVCGPTTCAATKTACDATQFTNHAMGQSLDESVIEASFLKDAPTPAPVPVKPVTPVVEPPKPTPAPPAPETQKIILKVNGTEIILDSGKDYTISAS